MWLVLHVFPSIHRVCQLGVLAMLSVKELTFSGLLSSSGFRQLDDVHGPQDLEMTNLSVPA